MEISGGEERYAAVFQAMSVAVLLFSVDLTIVDANPAAERFLGYPRERLIGLRADDIVLVEDLERESPFLAELIEGRRESYTIEKRYVHANGELVRGLNIVSGVRDKAGSLRWVLKVVVDVTPERQAEAERAAHDEQERQAQKMAALGRLAGGVAHDFNNLLQAISGNAQLALTADDLPAATGHISAVIDAASRAASLTEQLLTFSRKQPFETAPIDLNDVVGEIDEMLRRLLGVDVQLAIDLFPEPCVVDCDATNVQQALLNLVVNARDAMPSGGHLSIETVREQRPAGPYALLVVSDTGIGMDPATLDQAFDPFYTTKPVGEGTGLGLSTVSGIVAQCHGEIRVESAPGRGTRFEISFPEAPDAAQPLPAPLRAGDTVGGHETVLVVDDNAAVRALTGEYLAMHGYDVLEAVDGFEALELAEDARIDLLVTDVVMPRMNGRDLCRKLRTHEPGLPVLYTSGYDPHTVNVPENEPHAAFLRKPYDLVELTRAIRSLLDESPGTPGS